MAARWKTLKEGSLSNRDPQTFSSSTPLDTHWPTLAKPQLNIRTMTTTLAKGKEPPSILRKGTLSRPLIPLSPTELEPGSYKLEPKLEQPAFPQHYTQSEHDGTPNADVCPN
ncbi:hypothetical protein AAFF_G00019430 [Aldrovandia affinis]|uniref:Uncharacterized protein n=1 Tax=Aldrovandia affinis TaxID=143900 RepID=A0AAD7S7R2_9TELE|nr:hypothetical protein AAFF_G00019430 [Aldrovandia affinis]